MYTFCIRQKEERVCVWKRGEHRKIETMQVDPQNSQANWILACVHGIFTNARTTIPKKQQQRDDELPQLAKSE